jgi:hypothetical protein
MKMHINIPDQTVADLESGWAVNYDFLREVESIANLGNPRKDISLSDIENVILALQELSERRLKTNSEPYWNIVAPLPEVRPAWLRIFVSLTYIPLIFPIFIIVGFFNRVNLTEILDLYWNELLIPCLRCEYDTYE